MNTLVALVTGRARFTIGLSLLISLAGFVSWFEMPREEDPRLAERNGLLVVPFPGADAEQIERLVVVPLEEELAEVDAIESVEVTIRSSVAVVSIELRGDVAGDETSEAWDEVEEALSAARREMPDGVREGDLDHRLVETESIVLAVRGSTNVLRLADAAAELRRRLLSLADVSRVEVAGDPEEQVTVALDEAMAARLGLPPERLAAVLRGRNVIVPGGSIRVGNRSVELRPGSEMQTVEELRATPVVLPSGAAVPLETLASVRRMPREPVSERARVDGEVAVVLGVVPKERTDAAELGAAVRREVDRFVAATEGVRVDEIAYQPDKVEERLGELGTSLLVGIGIVAVVLFLTMGLRLGLVVSSIVPLVTFAALATYAAGGGVLHQMAVAALVLSLGLLVDNAIVMAETVQRRLDEGNARRDAVVGAIRELALPLASATATTLAAFVPMLLAESTSGDFTRAIPIVAMVTLSMSYLYALAVTPSLSGFLLRRRTDGVEPGRVERAARHLGRLAVRRPAATLGFVLAVVAASGGFVGGVRMSFFPSSDREQMVVNIELPEGTHLVATDDAARRLEQALTAQDEVLGVSTFIGRSAPSFYYNLPRQPAAPHLAQLVVTTTGPETLTALQTFVRNAAATGLPNASVVARRLEQGPPVRAPVEVRLLGDDLGELELASQEVRRLLRDDPAAVDIRSDVGAGSPRLSYTVDDAQTGRYGWTRQQLAVAMLGRTLGLSAGTYRAEESPIPVVLRGALGEEQQPADLEAITLRSDRGALAPLSALTTHRLDMGPSVIRRADGRRVVSVLADVVEGQSYADVVAVLTPKLEALELPRSVDWEYLGAVESSAKANASLGAKAPIGAFLLIAILLAQFNSLRRVGIVLFTAPMAVMGIWPGLYIADLPFGFVALLGAIALIGIVVNSAIVLIDLADHFRAEGMSVAEAIEHAVARRARPILLTTLTTIAGLAPLLFSESTLWPPMAAAMISGLTIATALTLLGVPALYRLLLPEPRPAIALDGGVR